MIHQLRDGIRTCMRLEDDECSGYLSVKLGLHHGCVFNSLQFNIFFVAMLHVALTRFGAEKDVMDALANLRNRNEGKGKTLCYVQTMLQLSPNRASMSGGQ